MASSTHLLEAVLFLYFRKGIEVNVWDLDSCSKTWTAKHVSCLILVYSWFSAKDVWHSVSLSSKLVFPLLTSGLLYSLLLTVLVYSLQHGSLLQHFLAEKIIIKLQLVQTIMRYCQWSLPKASRSSCLEVGLGSYNIWNWFFLKCFETEGSWIRCPLKDSVSDSGYLFLLYL